MKLFSQFAKTSATLHPDAGIGFGCMGITSFYGPAMDLADAMDLLKTVYDEGCRHFDTAEMYGNDDPSKHNEVYLGKFFQTVPRDSFSVATKFWPTGTDCGYDVVKEHLMGSLKRLQLDSVDLYYSHRVTSVENGVNFVKAAQRLKEEGLIKEIGLSEVNGAWLQQIVKESGVTVDAVQQEWSILTRSLEEELVPVCRKLGVTIVAYSPLCRNLLVQTKTEEAAPAGDWRADLPRYKAYEQNKKFASQVHGMAVSLKCTPAQICLAWIYQKAAELKVSVVPIPGTTKPDRAVGNIKSMEVTLSDDNMKILDAMADQVVGDRYMEGGMANGMTIESQQKK